MTNVSEDIKSILSDYDTGMPVVTADRLKVYWLQFETKSVGGIKAEERALQETAGTPVPILKKIGKTVAKETGRNPRGYLPLAQLLWNDFGREGRVISAIIWGKIELADPEKTLPILRDLCRSCYTWEDADRLAMDGIEPIVRKQPDRWLVEMEPWLEDSNKWVRRAGVTVIGRLPMKHAEYTGRCLALTQQLLLDSEEVVKKAVSFAIRLCARGDARLVRDFLDRQVPPDDPRATWVLCDAIRSMASKLRPEFVPLLPNYERWAAGEQLSSKDRRSVESAIRTLQAAAA